MEKQAAGKAVTIYVRQDDGSYKLDVEALGAIMNQEGVGDLPIMVLSVAGAMREGKSFLLNLFIKYLESEQSEEWLKDNSKLEGFSWRGGADRDTLGILMWTKPFHIKKSGQKVAVLLMDTQGAFDNEHTLAQSTKIFTMSLMMCSVQIYNVMQSLRADKLDFFALFLEHAKMVKKETKENVFQSLMFLVRDWPHQDDHECGLDGGTVYIKKQLQRFSKDGKLQKKDFKHIFNSYEGFLLPYPGEKIAERRRDLKSFEGETSDMNEDFAKYVTKLARHVFRQDHIIKKTIAGKEVNGRTLLAYAESIAKLFENKDMPEPKDLVEAQIQAHCSHIIDEFTHKFREKVTQFLPADHFIDDEALEKKGASALAATMEEFEKRQIYGGEDAKKDCRDRLDADLNHALEEAKIRNRDTRNKYRKRYEDFLVKEGDKMEKELGKTFDNRCVLEEEIQKACRDSAQEVQKKLRAEEFGVESFDEEFVKKIEYLEQKLCDTLLGKNKSELAVANTTSKAMEAELAHLAKSKLLKELDVHVCSTKLELNEVVERIKAHVWERWTKEFSDYPDFVLEKYKTSLQGKLEQLPALAEEYNAENQEKFSKDTSWELSETCKKYNEEMTTRVGKKSHDKEALQEFHRESYELARTDLEQRDIPAKLKQACLEKVETALAKELAKIERTNDERRDSFESSCGLQKSTCLDTARERIKERCGDNILSEDQIRDIHAEAGREARETFQRQKDAGSKSVYERHEAELNRELDKLFSVAKKMSKDFENYFLLTKTAEMKTAKKEYKKAMMEITGRNEPVEESELEKFHSKIANKTEEAFMSKLGKIPPDVENECRKMLQDTLKNAFNDVQRENAQKKRDCESKAKQIVAECLAVYNTEMIEATKGKILEKDEMESNHNTANGKAYDKMNVLKPTLPGSTAATMEKNLKELIDDRYDYFKQDTNRRKVWAENQVGDRMEKLEQVYKQEIDDLTAGKPWSTEDLRRHHRAAVQKVEEKAKSIGAGEIRQLCLDQIDKAVRAWLSETENGNQIKEDRFRDKCSEVVKQAKAAYKREMSRKGLFLTDNSLRDADDHARQSATNFFLRSGLKGPDETIRKYENDLQNELNDEFDTIRTANNDDLNEMDSKANELIKSARESYVKQMGKTTENAAMSDEELQAKHSRIVQSIIENEIEGGDLHITFERDAKSKFLRQADEEFSAFVSINRKRKVKQDIDIRAYIERNCVESYKGKMRELCGGTPLVSSIRMNHPQAKQSADAKFRDYNGAWDRTKEREYLGKLDQLCVQSKDAFVCEGQEYEAKIDREANSLLSEAEDQYRNCMTQECGSLELEQSKLNDIHRQATNQAKSFMNRSQANQQVKDAALKAFEKALGSIYDDFKSSNRERLLKAESVAARKLKDAEDYYDEIMGKHIAKVCCHNLNPKHEAVKNELQGRDASITGINKSGRAFSEFKNARDKALVKLFNKHDQTNAVTQADRKQRYERTVGDVFETYKSRAHQQWKESDRKKWFFMDGKIANFEKHHPDIKKELICVLWGKLPPNHCPSCSTCNNRYVETLENKIDTFKSSQVEKLESGRKWTS